MTGNQAINTAIDAARAEGRPALVAFLTGGYPTREGFLDNLAKLTSEADIVEIGVPFTDPMADGMTIQNSSSAALAQGVTLNWILEQVGSRQWDAPVLLMSYLNPLLSLGDNLAKRCAAANVAGIICPDLPLDECDLLRVPLAAAGVTFIQLVTPVTAPERIEAICKVASGFIYAVTVTGTTGGARSGGPAGDAAPVTGAVIDYLKTIKQHATVPVCVGFGIRSPEQVKELGAHADGVIVGSALVEELTAGRDPAAFVRYLKGGK
ncbi:MAG: tryptophan synthase subunit alpha [Gammaproteobacteria bacterium]|nr:tryptophan synthase subunit alpha [Gammaproteobacteria bacterium]